MKILILANSITGLISFRKEVVEAILEAGYEVSISAPSDERMQELESIGAKCIVTEIDRRSTNTVADFVLMLKYYKLIMRMKPDVLLTYTIKPNVYGGMVGRLCGVPQIANITGLGTAVENGGLLQRLIVTLYKIGLKKARVVFFQNPANRDFCLQHHMVPNRTRLIPGSGVNLDRFQPKEYPDGVVKFLYIGRLMVDKGSRELFETARFFRKERDDVEFHIVGGCEESFDDELNELVDKGVVVYHGKQKDVRPFIAESHCLLHPSYHEGMSNVILEASATARPIITTDANGCRDAVEDGVTGLLAQPKNASDLIGKVNQFLDMPWQQRREMGLAARTKVEREFDRQIVVDAYLEEIKKYVIE